MHCTARRSGEGSSPPRRPRKASTTRGSRAFPEVGGRSRLHPFGSPVAARNKDGFLDAEELKLSRKAYASGPNVARRPGAEESDARAQQAGGQQLEHPRQQRAEIVARRGQTRKPVTNPAAFTSQHFNGPTSWAVEANGEVKHVYA